MPSKENKTAQKSDLKGPCGPHCAQRGVFRLTERSKYLSVPKTGVDTGGTCSGAGADSTASTMQSFCHLVLNSEPVHKKLITEIVDAEKSEHLSEIITCIQFGGGNHLCIGRNLGLVEMNKVLPQLLRR